MAEPFRSRATGDCCSPRVDPTQGVPGDAFKSTSVGDVPAVTSVLSVADRLGRWKVRWGIGRDRYRVVPGLYALGGPDERSPVMVTANYKLSFDQLRCQLRGLDAWILVLDTNGINVWCAAGKGTFGTDELVNRIQLTELARLVTHRTLLVPQLGATGVAGYIVKQRTGFNVIFGPVRARDIKAFLEAGMKATPEMRRVTFTLSERMTVAQMDLVAAMKYFLVYLMLLGVLKLVTGSFSLRSLAYAAFPVFGALLLGALAVPALLPWIPFRSFALKGWLMGVAWAIAVSMLEHAGPAGFAGNLLLLPALSSFVALNYTGATTFTSQTGVNKEIRLFARPMAMSAILGIALLLIARP
ncbi:MAG: mercury methylation corrinoid protein HgcA [Acidobacteriota bacterium]